MRRKGALILIAIAFAFVGFSVKKASTYSAGEADGKKSKDVQWLSFDKGMALAKKNNKLMVVDFYTDWCHWCKVMDEQTYGDNTIVKYAAGNAVMVKLNAETEKKFEFKGAKYTGRQLSQLFGVTGFPTTVFISPKGELITSVSGFIPPEKFITILKYLAGNHYEKMKYDEFVKQEEAKNKG